MRINKIFSPVHLKKIIIVSLLIHLVASVYSVGFHHLDEHYQILEFAGLKLGHNTTAEVPWEYSARVRPTIQPTIAYFIIEAANATGISNPFDQAMIMRMLSATLSIICMLLLYIAFKDKIANGNFVPWFIFLSFFLWFLIYMQVRFSSEGWSGSFFFIGFALLFIEDKPEKIFLKYFLIGLILGFSFLFRYQSGVMIFGLLLWLILIKKEKLSKLLLLITGVTTAIVIGILIDKWFYGDWVLTVWNYLDFNILQGKASKFGVQPWYFYLKEIFREGIPPFSILLIGSFLFVFTVKPKSIFTWILLPFLLVHFMIGHKELRFLFPLANIVPLIVILSADELNREKFSKFKKYFANRYWNWFLKLFIVINFIYLVNVCFRPADYFVSLYHYVYNSYNNEKTVLLYPDEDPYLRAPEPAVFYMSTNLKRVKIENNNDIEEAVKNYPDDKVILLTDRFLLDDKYKRDDLTYRKVYQNLPKWVEMFNYNHWLERTKIFTVYEVSNVKSETSKNEM